MSSVVHVQPSRIIALLACVLGFSMETPLAAAGPDTPLTDAVQVAAGERFTCTLQDSGQVRCWGSNKHGELGNGGIHDSYVAIPVIGLSHPPESISAGPVHACVVTNQQQVQCWGLVYPIDVLPNPAAGNIFRQPITIEGLEGGVTQVAAGSGFSCALMTDGSVRCWGLNDRGQLGDGTTQSRFVAVPVVGLESAVTAIAAGGHQACAVVAGGGLRCWGGNELGQLGDGTTTDSHLPVEVVGIGSAQQVATGGRDGSFRSCAVLSDGAVKCWGGGGELGDGGSTASVVPVDVFPTGSTIEQVAVAEFGSICARRADGAVFCWGGNLGVSEPSYSPTPFRVPTLEEPASDLAMGDYHTCVVVTGGVVRCWGPNGFGELGLGRTGAELVSQRVQGLIGTARQLEVGNGYACVINSQEQIQCWGQALFPTATSAAIVPDISSARSIALSGQGGHACAIDDLGIVRCWGDNNFGQLGDGSTFRRHQPGSGVPLSEAADVVSLGDTHTCAILDDGSVHCWGRNTDGQVAGLAGTDALTPVRVDLSGQTAIGLAAGEAHTCALLQGGAVACWGRNEFFELGVGDNLPRTGPVSVPGLSRPVVQIAAFSRSTCALLDDGNAACWSQGVGVPTEPEGFPDLSNHLSLGAATCAASSNEVRCAGFNILGEVGDGTTVSRAALTAVAGLGADVLRVEAGASHSCVLLADGSVRCWGDNRSGQIGIGVTSTVSLPAAVLTDDAARELAASTASADSDSASTSTSASGRHIVFQSASDALSDADSNGATDIYRRDTVSGEVELVSLDNRNAAISGDSTDPSVSADGELVVFVAPDAAVRKLRGEGKSAQDQRRKAGTFGVFLRNMLTGSTQRVGTGSGQFATKPMLAPGGGAVVFTGENADPAQGELGQTNVLRVPLQRSGNEVTVVAPERPLCLSCKSADDSSLADGPSRNAAVSADGNVVVWETEAKNLLSTPSPCPAAGSQIMLRNLLTGQLRRIGEPASAGQCGPTQAASTKPRIDFGGGKVVFESTQPLLGQDRNQQPDAYLVDLANGQLRRVSETLDGIDGNGAAYDPQISGDGQTISFVSTAKNLEPREPDNNEAADIHVLSLRSDSLRRLTRATNGDQANAASDRPALDYMGKTIAFDSTASNLTADTVPGQRNVFQRANPLDVEVVFAASFE